MAYLNGWDRTIPNLDVVDDYQTEREEVRAHRGNTIPFSFGDVSNISHSLNSFSSISLSIVYRENSPG